MKVNSRFTFEKIRHDRDNDIHLVLDLVAPKSEWQAKRPPVCIIPVLDCSVSMQGQKLHYAKQSLLKLVEHLSSDDYLGLVSFASDVRPDVPVGRMTAERKEQVKQKIGDFEVRGSTNLSGGLSLALEMAKNTDLPESTLIRVILFTDGQPTHGVTTGPELCALLDKQRGHASVSAFGYGDDAAQDLLGEMSTTGKGNFAYVKNPDSALAAFGKELGGLLSMYAQDIEVVIKPRNGHLVTEVLTDADVEEENDGEVTVKLPQILSEETFNVALSVKMAKQKSAGPRQVNAFDVAVRYKVLDADGKMVTKTEEAKAKIQFVKDGEEQATATKEVDEIVARAQLVKTQIAAEEEAKKGNFQQATMILTSFQADAKTRGHVGVAAIGDHLGTMYGSSVNYASSAGSRTAMRGAMTRSVGSSGMALADQAVLASAGYVTSNSAQEELMASFQADSEAPADDAKAPVRVATPDWTYRPVQNLDLSGSAGYAGTPAIDWGAISTSLPNDWWRGPAGTGVDATQGASTETKGILIAPPNSLTAAPVSAGAHKPAGKTSKSKKPSPPTKSGLKKSRSQRW